MYTSCVPTLFIIYASTSGHTEYVIDTLVDFLKGKGTKNVTKQIAEKTQADDLLKGDVLLLASSTWNTGNVEGQLNPHMFALLLDRAKAVDLKGKMVVVIGLGDERYFYTANSVNHLKEFVASHGGTLILDPLEILNEPYGQEKKIQEWGAKLLKILSV